MSQSSPPPPEPKGSSPTSAAPSPVSAPPAGTDGTIAADAQGRRLLNATAVMASGTAVSRVLGLVRAMLIAFILGNGTRQADGFNFANTVPTSLYLLLAGGTLNNVLVPQIIRAVNHDEDGGRAYVDRIITGLVMIMGAVTIVLTVATPIVMGIYVPAWTTPQMAEHWRAMVLMSYICMPQLFFYGVFFLIGQVLNAREKFGPMMWAPAVNNVVSIGVLVLYLLIWGQTATSGLPFTDAQAWLLAGGSTIGIIVQTLVLLPYLNRAGFHYQPRFDLKGTGLGATFHAAKWMIGYVALTSVAQIVVSRLASTATGAEQTAGGWLTYQNAYLIWVLPHSLLTVSLATAMLPAASRSAVAGDLTGVAAETRRALRLATTFLVPASIGLLVLADPVTQLAFGHGAGAADYHFVTWALIGLSIGLVPFTIQYLYLRAFFAMDNTKTPFLLQIWISGANAVFAILLVLAWNDPATVAARLGVAYSLCYVLGVFITHWTLKRRLPQLDGRDTWLHLGKVALATVPAAALAWGISWWFGRFTGLVLPIVGLVLAAGVAVLAFFFSAKRLGVPETASMIDVLRRRRPDNADTDASDAITDEVEGRTQPEAPSSAAAPEKVPDDRTLHPYDGTVASGTCTKMPKAQLALLEDVGMVGGAVQYPVAAMVRSNGPWWTVAAATRVTKNDGGYANSNVEPYQVFVTSYPTYVDDSDHEPFAWSIEPTSDDAAAAKALECVRKLPVPPEPPEPGSPATYTGRLAPHARCTAASATLLRKLEQVGRVGGAITYSRGQLVRANLRWWTVSVATQVHPNSQGYTRDNVEPTALFVTNAPSYKASTKARIVFFPITAKSAGAAGKKALGCLTR